MKLCCMSYESLCKEEFRQSISIRKILSRKEFGVFERKVWRAMSKAGSGVMD